MSKKKKYKKDKNEINIWTEEEYEEYVKGLYGLEYIAGYTEGGIPYGLSVENDNNNNKNSTNSSDNSRDSDEEIPF